MKAERRHDLKTNALARVIDDFPGIMREYGSRIVLGVLVAVLAVILVFNYTTGRVAQNVQVHEAISSTRDLIGRSRQRLEQTLSIPEMTFTPDMSMRVAGFREQTVLQARQILKDASTTLQPALSNGDASVKAEAQVLRGDINMLLASIPSLPGSDTRPVLNGEQGAPELLKTAEEAYDSVLQPPLNQNLEAARSARFSLAAIAENRSEWDKAKQLYQQIIDDTATPPAFKDYARDRQSNLTTLQKPIMLATRPALGTMEPTSLPADLLERLRTILASQPTTMPAATTQSEK